MLADIHIRLLSAIRRAFIPALKTAWWVSKIVVGVTLVVAVANYVGIVDWISEQLSPLFGMAGLPGSASLAFLSGATSTIYSAVAVMATVGIDYRSAIIFATMQLICHNLIVESAVQRRAGASPWFIVPLRIGVAFAAGIALNHIVPKSIEGELFLPPGLENINSWSDVFVNWFMTLWPLLIKMCVLIVSLNLLQSILREMNILQIIAYPLKPLLRLFGLPESTAFLWIICNVVGITYGGAAIIDELHSGKATPRGAFLLNTHAAISHSQIEDTLIFVAIGIPVFWVIIPRVLIAGLVVWCVRAYLHYHQVSFTIKAI